MRYLTAKPRPREKSPHPSRLAASPSPTGEGMGVPPPALPPTSHHRNDFRSPPVGVGAPDDPNAFLPANLPSIISTFALPCLLLSVAERWMRSNTLPSAKPRPRNKTPHPSAFGCHLLPPEKAWEMCLRKCVIPRTVGKYPSRRTPHPSAFGCHLLPPEKA